MSYRITYQVNVEWVGDGMGPMSGNTAVQLAMAPAGGAQTLALFNTKGGYMTKTFLAADITTLTNDLAADIAAQMTTNITRIQNFSTGTD
jgi:hypothetical protein